MYGTIFRIKVNPGKEKEVANAFKEWDRQRKPKVKGVVAGFLLKPDGEAPENYIGVAVFRDKASYMANANDPEQDAWYQKIRKLLKADPVWHDGEFVAGGVA